jgi:hypothetical protein
MRNYMAGELNSKRKWLGKKSELNTTSVTFIKPKSSWQIIDLKELKDYRDLFYFPV